MKIIQHKSVDKWNKRTELNSTESSCKIYLLNWLPGTQNGFDLDFVLRLVIIPVVFPFCVICMDIICAKRERSLHSFSEGPSSQIMFKCFLTQRVSAPRMEDWLLCPLFTSDIYNLKPLRNILPVAPPSLLLSSLHNIRGFKCNRFSQLALT